MDTLAAKTFWVMRHGRPDLPRNPFFMNRDLFNRFLESYDLAALSAEESARLAQLYERYPIPDAVVCSDLPRAHATAKIFGRTAPIIVDPIFREIPIQLPEPSSLFLKSLWPAEVWWSYLRVNWFRNQGPEGKDRSRQRATEAIVHLRRYQHDYPHMALVSHAGFISLLITLLHQQHQINTTANIRWQILEIRRIILG
ncbi:histidine phosphatase family protein [Sulfobacillus thermotolerans]|uniref:histidine phosphatase family protein n=1 Tax=Sulfobacillus thermotolerans TaxID=338644 RepID=UPI0033667171